MNNYQWSNHGINCQPCCFIVLQWTCCNKLILRLPFPRDNILLVMVQKLSPMLVQHLQHLVVSSTLILDWSDFSITVSWLSTSKTTKNNFGAVPVWYLSCRYIFPYFHFNQGIKIYIHTYDQQDWSVKVENTQLQTLPSWSVTQMSWCDNMID